MDAKAIASLLIDVDMLSNGSLGGDCGSFYGCITMALHDRGEHEVLREFIRAIMRGPNPITFLPIVELEQKLDFNDLVMFAPIRGANADYDLLFDTWMRSFRLFDLAAIRRLLLERPDSTWLTPHLARYYKEQLTELDEWEDEEAINALI